MPQVPNTTTFTLLDVVAAIGAGNPTTLADAFALSVDSAFDPLYKGSKNNMLNFRNYNEAAASIVMNVQPPGTNVSSAGGTVTISVLDTNGNPYPYAWTASETSDWLSISPLSGTGGASSHLITATVPFNNTGTNRTAIVWVTSSVGGSSDSASIFQYYVGGPGDTAENPIYFSYSAGYNLTSGSTACSNRVLNILVTIYSSQSSILNILSNPIYSNNTGTTNSPAGWYALRDAIYGTLYRRYWSGTAWSGVITTC